MEALMISGGFAIKLSLLKNAWRNQYSQPPNSTSGGIHMTQNIHDFVEWANPIKNSPKWSCHGS
jgi:hypothetical protein